MSQSVWKGRPVVLSVNQDPGIGPDRAKGAAVHLRAMREAFAGLGATCLAVDEPEEKLLMQALEEHQSRGPVDMIYERYALGKSAAARFASAHGIPLVLEVNAPLADEQRRWRGLSDEAEDLRHDAVTMKHACRVIAVSRDVAHYAVNRGACSDRVEVFPNGIDSSRFNREVRRSSVRPELVPPGRFVIGFHGRLRPWHGFGMLVDVAVRLLAAGHDIHLLVVGEGDFEELSHLPEQQYTRVGWQAHEEMPRYVAAFDVLPLTYQPNMPCYFSPLKLMEAMACGVVPLVPDLGDLPEAVEHGKTGLVYPAGDRSRLFSELEKLILDRGELERLGERAAEEAGRHSWIRIAAFAMAAAGGDGVAASGG